MPFVTLSNVDANGNLNCTLAHALPETVREVGLVEFVYLPEQLLFNDMSTMERTIHITYSIEEDNMTRFLGGRTLSVIKSSLFYSSLYWPTVPVIKVYMFQYNNKKSINSYNFTDYHKTVSFEIISVNFY